MVIFIAPFPLIKMLNGALQKQSITQYTRVTQQGHCNTNALTSTWLMNIMNPVI